MELESRSCIISKLEIINGEEKDEMAVLHGIRTLKLIQKPDEKGKSFYFELNGVPVFAKGANYIPADIFLTRVTPDDYERIVIDAASANMNMLRVWGGGIYENDIFYDLCDKYGILIWQDFMFACSLYPGDSAFMENVRLEAIDNVKRLRNHPCMALWCGNNECQAAWKDWGYEKKFKEKDPKLAEKVWNDYCKLFHRLLYGVVQEYQPDIAYWASSPMASWTPGMNDDKVARKTDNSGDRHYWDVWHGRQPFSKYAELIPRFMSEYGLQSFPGFRTVRTFAPSPSDWSIESEIMMHHQKNGRGNMLIRQYMQDWYQIPPRFEHFLYVSQLLQAEGIKVGMEALRRNMPYCMGSLYWQLNDCWPVASWSGIDSYHNWKALHYYAAKAYDPELVSPYIVNDSLQVHVVSDRLTAFTAEIELQVLDMKGSIILLKNYSKEISPNSSIQICHLPVSGLLNGKSKQEVFVLLRLKENQKLLSENSCYFVPFKDLKLQKPLITHSFVQNEDGGIIKLTSNVLAKNVFLDSETEGLRYSDNFFDLFPGQAIEIRITAPKGTSLKENQLSILSLFDTYPAN
ncbi:MAG: glycoside hydrolase family 2 protein [Bacteroidales bacterium]|nr:glycoside hydrolase family 2 protein [Bacteroidales bacterium]